MPQHGLRRAAWLVVALVLAAGTACRRQPPASAADWMLAFEPVASPAAGVSLAPQLTTSSTGTILSWIEQAGDTATLKFAERTASGWSAPATVAAGNNWFVSYADVPSVVRKRDGTLVANWLVETDASIEAYNLLLSYSRDNGRTWATPFMPHADGTTTQHGFASFFELPDNALGLVWLDGRQQELDTTSPEGGAMSLRAATFDASWTQTSDTAVDARVCECCPTTVAVTSDGVLTAYRDRSDAEVRDIRVSRLQGGAWRAGPLLHADGWTIPACPVNGPALSARDRLVAAAWFTVQNDEGHAYAAFSTDAGNTWGDPIRLDDAVSLGHVGIELLEDGSALALWVEFADQRAQVRARRIEPSGMRSQPMTVAGTGEGRASGIPRVALSGEEVVVAWTETTGAEAGAETLQQIKTAVARVPRATAVR
ncbi:MAG: sialidase family protein [Vicinamibacterales bacterium]